MPIERARPGEVLKDVLIVQNQPEWRQFAEVARRRGTSRSALIRRFVRREIKRARKRGEIGARTKAKVA